MIQIWKADTPAQRILEWVRWFCRGDKRDPSRYVAVPIEEYNDLIAHGIPCTAGEVKRARDEAVRLAVLAERERWKFGIRRELSKELADEVITAIESSLQ